MQLLALLKGFFKLCSQFQIFILEELDASSEEAEGVLKFLSIGIPVFVIFDLLQIREI